MNLRRVGPVLVAVASSLLVGCASTAAPARSPSDAVVGVDATVGTVDPSPILGPSSTTSVETTIVAGGPRTIAPGGPRSIELEDRSRAVEAGGRIVAATRVLPTLVWLPSGDGPHPLVILAHGYEVGTAPYRRLCATLAAAGFVVAAPSFPLADRSRGLGLDRADIPEEAIDVSFVIASLRAGPLASAIASGPVGVVGHSDGADVALLVARGRGYADPAVGAIVAIAPDAFTVPLAPVPPTPPAVLLVHSDADEIVPISESEQVFAMIGGSRTFVTLVGAPHLAPVEGSTRWTAIVDDATIMFLRATLDGGTDLAAARAAMAVAGLSSVRSAG